MSQAPSPPAVSPDPPASSDAANRYQEMRAAAEKASTLLKAMSNARRLLILCHLAEQESSVGELCAVVGVSQSALSQHLAKLRHDGLVTTRRDAQTIYYTLNGDTVRRVLDTLHDLYCADHLGAHTPDRNGV